MTTPMKINLLDQNTPRLGVTDIKDMLDKPGFYAFWMRTEKATCLGIDLSYALVKSSYSLVYIGIAKSIKKRQSWHWQSQFRDGNVIHGTISTFNQTLAAIIGKPYVAENESEIRKLMNDHMFVEVTYTDSLDQAVQVESDLLKGKALVEGRRLSCPLNIAKNVDHPYRAPLKAKRNEIRKLSVSIAQARRKK